jgi:hypothetical protein
VESLWYVSSLVVVILSGVAVLWQSISTTGYERQRQSNCEDRLERTEQRLREVELENERLQLQLMGRGGVRILGGNVTVGKNLVGGDSSEGNK